MLIFLVTAQSYLSKVLCGRWEEERDGQGQAVWGSLRKVAAPTQTLGGTQGLLGTNISVEAGGLH